jgi:hypothetical protein
VRRIILTILTLAILLPSAAFAGARYLCAMDGQVRTACCCPTKAAKQKRDAEPVTTMSGTCCCKVSTTSPTVTPQIKDEHARTAIPTVPVIVPVPAIMLPARERAIIANAIDSRPPKPALALVVRHRALLL